ncbi:Cof-type HAD-IIB family hydrolase [Virgibacillus sp. MSJ-26]|uniref:Cof-type HAD-IIB family hydrolase n=1 Tax=Virgibacillus sp. MSJ-26 TaxID=2841522 RepID=UPI001C125790|nr:Cof-type HAD-IIB family hydrolase [Virgibacillus sp. MSJ-26]MBU5468339.1 Cof-type HAD-IIB family hydrolase [Virgibacillus sp. MSJ-26]
MTQKIIFFDIDGTLLNDQKELPNSTEQSIQRLKKDGHIVAIATGRAPFIFKDLREQLGISSYVSLNGQYVVLNGKVVYRNPLNLPALNELVAFSEERNNPILYMSHADWRASGKRNAFVEDIIGSLKVPYKVTFESSPYDAYENFQAVLFCDAEEEELYKERFNQFNFIRWHEHSVDVLPTGGSKAEGIERLIKAADLKQENAYAFGDGLNDMEMLKYIPNSVAMGNALEPVKNVAKFVTKTVDEDGIEYGLKELGLLS